MTEAQLSAMIGIFEEVLGQPDIYTIDFDIDFVAGNAIDGSVNAVTFPTVDFTTDHDTTLQLLADSLYQSDFIFSAIVTGPKQITVTSIANNITLTIVGPTVTGGLVQAVATVTKTQAAIKIPVARADQDSPIEPPYATVRLYQSTKYGLFDETREVDPVTNLAPVCGQRKQSVRLDFFGAFFDQATMSVPVNPQDELEKAFNAMDRDTIAGKFSVVGLSILDKSGIQNLTDLVNTKYEPHASFDFIVGYATQVLDDVGFIDEVEIEGDFNQGEFTIGPKTIG